MNAPNGYTSDQAAQAAAAAGLVLSEDDYQAIERLQRAERARSTQLATDDETGIVATYARLFPKVLSALHAVGDSALSIVRTFVIAFGVPLTLGLLTLVEIQRVASGIVTFADNAAFAQAAAIAAVMANMVLEIIIHYRENKVGYQADRGVKWSLRIAARDFAYWLGIGANWRAVALSPAARFKKLQTVTTVALLFLAVTGSMAQAISNTPGKWYDALWAILTDSSLSSASVWVSGLTYSVVAILLAQGLTNYASNRVVEVLGELEKKQAIVSIDATAALDAVKTQYIAAKTAAKLMTDAELERQRIASEQAAERQRIEALEAAERARLDAIEVERLRIEAAERQEAANALARETPPDGRFLSVPVPSIADLTDKSNGHAH